MSNRRNHIAAKTALGAIAASTLCSGLFLLDIGNQIAPFAWGGALWGAVVAFAASGYFLFSELLRGVRALRPGKPGIAAATAPRPPVLTNEGVAVTG